MALELSLDVQTEIEKRKRELNAVILAHNYQLPEIQEIADFVGDSLELAMQAAQLPSVDYIFFCGVHFMAETAAILAPQAKVILPDLEAGCPLADMITAEDVQALRTQHPDAPIVAYVNTTAAVKAEVDVCCTSANAARVVEALDAPTVIFVPDRHLAGYVARCTEKEIIPWQGFCPTHQLFTPEDVERARAAYPDALIVVHPECRAEVQEKADYIRSTGGMMRLPAEVDASSFVIGTEIGLLHRLKRTYPQRNFYPLNERAVCPNMKKITLEKLLVALRTENPVVEVDRGTALRAKVAIRRMLELV